jgi:hypothetical protein
MIGPRRCPFPPSLVNRLRVCGMCDRKTEGMLCARCVKRKMDADAEHSIAIPSDDGVWADA